MITLNFSDEWSYIPHYIPTLNKAGYTANISRGWVGRGGNVRFPTFRLVSTDRPTDGRMDKASYRVACPQLKRKRKRKRRSKGRRRKERKGKKEERKKKKDNMQTKKKR